MLSLRFAYSSLIAVLKSKSGRYHQLSLSGAAAAGWCSPRSFPFRPPCFCGAYGTWLMFIPWKRKPCCSISWMCLLRVASDLNLGSFWVPMKFWGIRSNASCSARWGNGSYLMCLKGYFLSQSWKQNIFHLSCWTCVIVYHKYTGQRAAVRHFEEMDFLSSLQGI